MELKRCREDPIYFMKKYIKVTHPTKGAVPFELYDYQEEMVMAIHENKDTVLLCSRQMGKTTVAAMYILWFAIFHTNKRCVIASKAMAHAVEIQSRVKFAYEELPHWMKPGCKFYNRTSIEFDNESKIICEATSEKTGRGSSPSIIFLDEIAFISRRIQEEMWASLTPALATGGKFIITSTPNGDSDLFARLWYGA
jgi:phage terminase large subunit-like protein